MSPLRESTLSVIGAGVMAEAIIAGVLERQLVPSGSIIASHPREDRRRALAEKYGVQVTADNADAARRGDVVVLGIKPQVMAGVLKEIRGSLAPDKLLISIIAGATTQSLRHGLDHGALPSHAQYARPDKRRRERLVRNTRNDRDAARAGPRAARCARPRAPSRRRALRRNGDRGQWHRTDLRLHGDGGAHRQRGPPWISSAYRP